jgi:hypothetical protein
MNKAMVLALGYQAGAERFVEMAAQYTDGKLQLTLEESQAAVEKFRTSSPLLADKERGMWYVLDRAFKQSAMTDKNFEFELPSGRVMRYHGIRRGVRTRTEDVDVKRIVGGQEIIERRKVPKRQFVYVVEVDGRTKSVYGGLLTENVTQAMARDVFAECYLALKDAQLHVPFTVHDEAVIEADPDVTAADIEALMAVRPDWAPGLPVAAEVKEVKHYLK